MWGSIMDYRISENVKNVKPSAIREIFKFLSVPGLISFAAGNPSPESFPTEEMEKALKGDKSESKFYKLLKGEAQRQTYKEFIAPIFILNAMHRSLISGKEEIVNKIESNLLKLQKQEITTKDIVSVSVAV